MVFGPNSSAPIPTWGNISLYSSDYVDQLAPFRLPVSPSAPIASEHEVAREIRQRTINLPGTCGGVGGFCIRIPSVSGILTTNEYSGGHASPQHCPDCRITMLEM